ncbi:protein NYNRIN-like [Anguilla anguilla]|uniref:protein NYNRIN-like n=1 Tax=Anguilla anguilla TaxID=7936 RepID=UPI0015B11A9B|nr:protein NYNRIN-like [Anguilla anguilla]
MVKKHTGWAVCTQNGQLVKHGRLVNQSAQVAELWALAEACTVMGGNNVNIYTDSRYAFGVVHDYLTLWANRGFLTSAGSPIQNGGMVEKLHKAIELPKNVAVIKIKAHTKGTDPHSNGNRWADEWARKAATDGEVIAPIAALQTAQLSPKENVLQLEQLQHAAPRAEKWLWMENGGKLGEDNIWRGPNNTVILPAVLMSTMVSLYHSLGHDGARRMQHRMKQTWWHPKLNTNINDYVRRCITCARCNPGPTIKVRMRQQPRPEQPFAQLQIDFIGPLPGCRGKKYVLVLIDHFTKWVEAFPTAHNTATDVAKVLLTEIIPRWGLPCAIDSDQGTHFTGKIIKTVCRALGIKQKFHCPFHPQSSGLVERANRSLKNKLTKQLFAGTGKDWVSHLPAVLLSLRAGPTNPESLSPFEMLTGRPMRTPGDLCIAGGELHVMGDKLLEYCKLLSQCVPQDPRTKPDPVTDLEESPAVQPGDQVLVKSFQKKTFGPHWTGPHTVLLTTPSAARLTGIPTWIHLTRLRKYTSPTQHEAQLNPSSPQSTGKPVCVNTP